MHKTSFGWGKWTGECCGGGGELGAVEEREPLSQIAAGIKGGGGLGELRGVVNRVLHSLQFQLHTLHAFFGKGSFFERQGVYQKARPSGACSPPRRWPTRTAAA